MFEPPRSTQLDRAALDPVGGMQGHTGYLTRALDELGVAQRVVTAYREATPRRQRLGARSAVHRVGVPTRWSGQRGDRASTDRLLTGPRPHGSTAPAPRGPRAGGHDGNRRSMEEVPCDPGAAMDSLIAALGLAAVHVGAGALHVLDRVPRSRWLSAAAGVALAYVFVHLLPELAEVQRSINERGLLPLLARHTYLAALAGVVTYHSLEVLAHRRGRSRTGATTWDGVGTLHLGSYAALNVIIGYLLVERAGHEDASLWLFTVAMGVHLLVNDRGLRRHHGQLYHRVGRWLVSAAVVAGWALGRTTTVGPTAVGLPLAFLAGGVVLNVLKEELPGDRESRPLPLVAAGALYTAVLLAV